MGKPLTGRARPAGSPAPGGAERLEGHEETDKCLHRPYHQQRGMRVQPPGAPAKRHDDGACDDEDEKEAEHMVAIRHPSPADGVGRVKMTQQAEHQKRDTGPPAKRTCVTSSVDGRRSSHDTSYGVRARSSWRTVRAQYSPARTIRQELPSSAWQLQRSLASGDVAGSARRYLGHVNFNVLAPRIDDEHRTITVHGDVMRRTELSVLIAEPDEAFEHTAMSSEMRGPSSIWRRARCRDSW
jgi:hypothetical protein